MSAWDGLNRRRFPRIGYPCMVTLRHESKESDSVLAHTENIGVGGIGLILKQNLKLFSPVSVEVDLMDMQDHLVCEGRVVWAIRRRTEETKKPSFYDIGIEFNHLEDEDRARLEKIIQKLLKKNPKV